MIIYVIIGLLSFVSGFFSRDLVPAPPSCQEVGDSVVGGSRAAGYEFVQQQSTPGGGQVVVLGDKGTGDVLLVAFTFGDEAGRLVTAGFSDVSACTTPDGGRAHVLTKQMPSPVQKTGGAT